MQHLVALFTCYEMHHWILSASTYTDVHVPTCHKQLLNLVSTMLIWVVAFWWTCDFGISSSAPCKTEEEPWVLLLQGVADVALAIECCQLTVRHVQQSTCYRIAASAWDVICWFELLLPHNPVSMEWLSLIQYLIASLWPQDAVSQQSYTDTSRLPRFINKVQS